MFGFRVYGGGLNYCTGRSDMTTWRMDFAVRFLVYVHEVEICYY